VSDPIDESRRVPLAPACLGGAGLLPFVGLALIVWVGPSGWQISALDALAAYAALILSFLGGVRWGLAAAGLGGGPGWLPLGLSVVPSLYAWGVLFSPDPARLVLLSIGFAGLLAADLALTRRGGAPPWWPTLRWPLSVVAAVSLLIAAAV